MTPDVIFMPRIRATDAPADPPDEFLSALAGLLLAAAAPPEAPVCKPVDDPPESPAATRGQKHLTLRRGQ